MSKGAIISLLLLYAGFIAPVTFYVIVIPLLVTGAVLWIIAMIKCIRERSKKWLPLLLLNPFVIFSILATLYATITYSIGKAQFFFNQSDGSLHLYSEQHFDFQYRVFYRDFKGEHYGYFNLFSARRYYMGIVEDKVIKTLVNTFGYQHNMYKGYIPGAAETWQAVTTTRPDSVMILEDPAPDRISFNFRGKHHSFIIEDQLSGQSLFMFNNSYSVSDTIYPDDTTVHHDSRPIPKPMLYVSTKYYPLLINILPGTMDDGPCVNMQLLDLVHDKVIAGGIVDSMNRRGEYCGQFDGDMIVKETKSLFRYGCTDPKALNYDSNANCEDHSCIYVNKRKKKAVNKKATTK